MPYTKKNGDNKSVIDWGKIGEHLIGGLALILVIAGINWFLVVRDLRRDMADLKTEFRREIGYIFQQNSIVGKTLWNHIHPNEPCPWPEVTRHDHEEKK